MNALMRTFLLISAVTSLVSGAYAGTPIRVDWLVENLYLADGHPNTKSITELGNMGEHARNPKALTRLYDIAKNQWFLHHERHAAVLAITKIGGDDAVLNLYLLIKKLSPTPKLHQISSDIQIMSRAADGLVELNTPAAIDALNKLASASILTSHVKRDLGREGLLALAKRNGVKLAAMSAIMAKSVGTLTVLFEDGAARQRCYDFECAQSIAPKDFTGVIVPAIP